jgi:carbon-monoxide dehydrogenase large subunit
MSKFGISQPVRRVEDARFVTGAGRYVDDIQLEHQAYGYVARSPVARARIQSLDVEAARAAPRVLDVITGDELERKGRNDIPCRAVIPGCARPKRPILCTDRVCYVGDNMAFVVAETLAQAKEAADLIAVDYDDREPVVDTRTADAPGTPLVHEDVPSNLFFDWTYGDAGAVATAFESAAHVARIELVNNRVVANPLEPRGAIAEYDPNAGRLTVNTGTQGVWSLKDLLCETLAMPGEHVRVVTPDVGGGFGMKGVDYPEQVLVAWAARKLGRPVRWISERSEGFVSDVHGRDHVTRAELAFDDEHRILGMRVSTRANLGAYLSQVAPFVPTRAALKVLPGVYDVGRLHYRVQGVATNTVPVDAYRGAGRPEAIYVLERLLDVAARDLGLGPVALRRRNMIPASAMPFTTAVGETYDSGEFERVMDAALDRSDWAGFALRREHARRRGARRGIGLAYYIEATMGAPRESAAIRFTGGGVVEVLVGTQSNGQGHETAYTQIVHQHLGVPFETVRVVQGDSDRVPSGGGTGGSRSVTIQGWALGDASNEVIERGKRLAGLELEAAAADIEFDAGRFRIVGTDRAIDIMELARRSLKRREDTGLPEDLRAGLHGEATVDMKAWTFPNGCHVAEVEIDPDTGTTRLVRYTVVDDFGRVINPLLLAGQVHGGVAQGVGQALLEHAVYDEFGQLVTGSFMDYCMPRADDLPAIDFSTIEVPCRNNPLGMKGAGEAGTVGSLAAVMNAVADALADAGIAHIDMPATPLRIWQALKGTF